VLLPTAPAFLHLQAGRRPYAGGVCFAGRRIGWGELAAATDELGTWLAARGVGAGDPIAVMAANEPAIAVALWAVWGLGAIAVPIGVRSTAAEASRLLEHAGARAILADARRTDVARDAAAGADAAAWACEPDLPLRPRVVRRRASGHGRAPLAPRPEARAAIAYTSGTTGAPKGVVLTHANFLWSTHACAGARGDVAESVGACLSPLTHVPVLISHLLCRVLLGQTAVLLEKFDVDAVLDAVERFGVTDLPLIGGMVFDVVKRGAVPPAVAATVKKVTVGGAPTPMEAKRALAGIFSGAEVIEAYGQTESTDGVTMARGTSVFDRPGTVGRPNPFVRVAIRRPDGTLAGTGEEGEIVIGGPTVMAGYHRDKRATTAAIRQGWLHTGDLGRQDADDWLFITGRVKDVIITGGENVSPVEVEAVLREHPDVADVAVIGTPHPRWGEQVTAVVVVHPGKRPSAGALADFAGARLAGFKKPRRVEFVDVLPRNAANKVQVALLRERFS
jgi:fatty-acyl-CoA synthase